MTTIERPREIWSTMPGWGIVANLTPPELIATRKLKSVRKVLLVGLVLLLMIGICLYSVAFLRHRSAAADLSSEQARTAQLQAQQSQYQTGVQVQSSINGVQTQLGSLLTDDVDQAALVQKIRAKLPANMTISQLSITLLAGTPGAAPIAGASSLDASGSTHIGSVTISGNSDAIADVSAFATALGSVSGVVTPYPSSSVRADKTVKWSVQLTLTSALLTHRYDASKIGAK